MRVEPPSPTLLVIAGGPAAGKMTVGQALSSRTGFPLYHNHLSIESVRPVFGFGEAAFHRLVDQQRLSMMEEAAGSPLPGLIFTYMWAFDLPSEDEVIARYTEPFLRRGGSARFLELRCPLQIRMERDVHPERLRAKPSKAMLTPGRREELQQQHSYESGDDRTDRDDWLVIDNSATSPDDVAEIVIERFGLPRKS